MADADNRQHDCRPCCLTHTRLPFAQGAVGVKGPPRPVLWALAVHASNEDGWCFLQTATLERETGLSRWTILRAVEHLEQIGAIEVKRHHRRASDFRIRFEVDPAGLCSTLLHKGRRRSDRRSGRNVAESNINVAESDPGMLQRATPNRGGVNGAHNGVHPTPPEPEPRPPGPRPGGASLPASSESPTPAPTGDCLRKGDDAGPALLAAWVAAQEEKDRKARVRRSWRSRPRTATSTPWRP